MYLLVCSSYKACNKISVIENYDFERIAGVMKATFYDLLRNLYIGRSFRLVAN